MNYKIFAVLFTFIALNIFAVEKTQAPPLEKLNYQLVKSCYPEDDEPSKYYKFTLDNPSTPSSAIFLARRMDGETSEFLVYVKENGTIWTEDKSQEWVFGCDGGYSEKFAILLVAVPDNEEPKLLASCEIVPFPRIKQDSAGHRIELHAASANGELFTFAGSGFAPKEKIIVESRSCNESMTIPVQADSQGNFVMGYAPAVIGKKEGPFELIFKGENMEPMKIRHYWGTLAFARPNKYRTLKNKYKFPDE